MKMWATIVTVNAMLIVCVLLVAELTFGAWFSGRDAGPLKIPVSYVHDNDSSHLYAEGRHFIFERDRYGLRGGHDDVGDVTVLAVGGSTTAQTATPDGLTWPDLLEAELRDRSPDVRVANGGIDGHSTFAHLVYVERWLPSIERLKPRFVVFLIGINDASRDAPLAGVDFAGELGMSARLMQKIRQNSALYGLYRTMRWHVLRRLMAVVPGNLAYGGMEAVVASDYAPLPREHRVRLAEPHADDERLSAYRSRVRQLISATQAYGAQPVIANQTTAYVLWKDGVPHYNRGYSIETAIELHRRYDAFAKSAMAACHGTAAACVDIAGTRVLEPGDIYDDMHTKPSGSRKIAAVIAAALRARLTRTVGGN